MSRASQPACSPRPNWLTEANLASKRDSGLGGGKYIEGDKGERQQCPRRGKLRSYPQPSPLEARVGWEVVKGLNSVEGVGSEKWREGQWCGKGPA